MGGYGGRGDGRPRLGRHEPRAHSHAGARRRRAPPARAHAQTDPGGRRPGGPADQRAIRSAAAPRVRRAGATPEAVAMRAGGRGLLIGAAAWRLAAGQGTPAVTSPAPPTGGGTVLLARDIAPPRGWPPPGGEMISNE